MCFTNTADYFGNVATVKAHVLERSSALEDDFISCFDMSSNNFSQVSTIALLPEFRFSRFLVESRSEKLLTGYICIVECPFTIGEEIILGYTSIQDK